MAERDQDGNNRVFSRRRVKVLVVGVVVAMAGGLVLAYLYSSARYGGSFVDRIVSSERRDNPNAGKHAYHKNSNNFIGVIKSEGYSSKLREQVYYIERAGGQLIEVPKSSVVVREPGAH